MVEYLWKTFGLYLLSMNIAAFACYGWDKFCAKTGKWRVPEHTLLFLAAIGGSIGAYLSMLVFRHKTQHLKFKFGVPIIFVIQVAIALYLYFIY